MLWLFGLKVSQLKKKLAQPHTDEQYLRPPSPLRPAVHSEIYSPKKICLFGKVPIASGYGPGFKICTISSFKAWSTCSHIFITYLHSPCCPLSGLFGWYARALRFYIQVFKNRPMSVHVLTTWCALKVWIPNQEWFVSSGTYKSLLIWYPHKIFSWFKSYVGGCHCQILIWRSSRSLWFHK